MFQSVTPRQRALARSLRNYSAKISHVGSHMRAPLFDKILIANRGEIACRVMRTAQKLGVKTVAVYSQADVNSLHVAMADEAYLIGPPAANQSYLCIDKIIEVAKKSGAQAIHPGYGFLSENANFADECEKNGIIFIGPPSSAIRSMGSKSESKILMEGANVPVVPGYHGESQSVEKLQAVCEKIGYPMLIKAVMGGGGKGMRIVHNSEEFEEQLLGAQREAKASFGDDRVLVEKYLVKPRHVEIQVFADKHGNAVYLFERDCSVQRRHQKVLEEAPAPHLSEETRRKMGESAVAAAKAVNYVGAGTVEFIVDASLPDCPYYFMEMNTRLQVEHPVTEMITGQDLVEWQLMVAAGYPLPLQQQDLKINGHSIEARIYAENPLKNFLPGTGKLIRLRTPQPSDRIRVETGVREGDEVSIFYDPMIAKLCVWGKSRDEALRTMEFSLDQYQIVGLNTNVEFLKQCILHPEFKQGGVDTNFIKKNEGDLLPGAAKAITPEGFALAAFALLQHESRQQALQVAASEDFTSPFGKLAGFRINHLYERKIEFELTNDQHKEKHPLFVTYNRDGTLTIKVGNNVFHNLSGKLDFTNDQFTVEINNKLFKGTVFLNENKIAVFTQDEHIEVQIPQRSFNSENTGRGSLLSPMPGKIVKILAQPGDVVKKNTPLVIMEAMKMEHTLRAPSDGVVKKIAYKVGDMVKEQQLLVTFEEDTTQNKE